MTSKKHREKKHKQKKEMKKSKRKVVAVALSRQNDSSVYVRKVFEEDFMYHMEKINRETVVPCKKNRFSVDSDTCSRVHSIKRYVYMN